MRSICSRMIRTPLAARSSPASLGVSCSARPAMIPSGVEISCATPTASVPMIAALPARSKRSSRWPLISASSSRWRSRSSLRWLRIAKPPKLSTRPLAAVTLKIRRQRAQRSRSRSRSALATAAIPHRPAGPASTLARPARAVRTGSPRRPASAGARRK
jgi:hypothetical protein